jgi:hypothetical protein
MTIARDSICSAPWRGDPNTIPDRVSSCGYRRDPLHEPEVEHLR